VGVIPFVFVINKCDLLQDWEVDSALETQLADKGWSTLRSSARTGEGVEDAFSLLSRKMLG
jgi:50S ribosomal subunit-associated GTPase HflX